MKLNRSLILALVILSALVYLVRFQRAWRDAEAFSNDPVYDAQERIGFWMASARCAQERGAFLALCTPQGELVPIENVSLADDRGHALLANLWAICKKKPFTKTDLTRIQLVLNATGLLALVGFLALQRLPIVSVVCLGLGPMYLLPGPIPGPDAPASYIGLVCFAVIPSIWIAGSRSFLWKEQWRSACLSGIALSVAFMFREPIGLIGIASTLGGLFYKGIWARAKTRTELKSYMGVGVVLLLPFLWTPAIISIRDTLWTVKPSHHVLTHGIAQTLFHGLGTEPNPWGISWKDSYGLEYVHGIDPSSGYLTPKYFKILRARYWDILIHHPIQVLRIYAIKLHKTVTFPFRIAGLPLWSLGLILLGIIPWLFRRSSQDLLPPLHVAAALLLFSGLFLMQGVLGIPWGNYLYPIKWLVLLELWCVLEWGFRFNFRRTHAAK